MATSSLGKPIILNKEASDKLKSMAATPQKTPLKEPRIRIPSAHASSYGARW